MELNGFAGDSNSQYYSYVRIEFRREAFNRHWVKLRDASPGGRIFMGLESIRQKKAKRDSFTWRSTFATHNGEADPRFR